MGISCLLSGAVENSNKPVVSAKNKLRYGFKCQSHRITLTNYWSIQKFVFE